MINDNLGATAIVNMEKGNVRISKNPKQISLAAGFIDMDKCCIRQRLLQRFVKWLTLFGNMLVKAKGTSSSCQNIAKQVVSL